MKKAISFMAVAKGQESKEVESHHCVGIAALKFVALNPTREELNKILEQNNSTEEIKYIGETTVKDKNNQDVNVPQIRLTFLMKTDPAIACNNGIEQFFFVTFFLSKAAEYSFKDGVTKMKVIDEYGRTAWVTPEQAEQHIVPEFIIRNGKRAGQTMKASITQKYRAAYRGEEDLTSFIKEYLVIPRPDAWNTQKECYEMKSNPKELEKSECLLEDVRKYFEGNLSELKKIFGFQANNTVKLLAGVRTASNGSQYQDFYTRMPLRLSVTNYKEWEKALQEDKAAGRHPNTEYRVCNLQKFTAQATDYSKTSSSQEVADPFATANTAAVEQVITETPIDTDPFQV